MEIALRSPCNLRERFGEFETRGYPVVRPVIGNLLVICPGGKVRGHTLQNRKTVCGDDSKGRLISRNPELLLDAGGLGLLTLATIYWEICSVVGSPAIVWLTHQWTRAYPKIDMEGLLFEM